MDVARFDRIMTTFAGATSRRAALGGLLGGAIALLGLEDAPARKQKGRKNKGNDTKKQQCKHGMTRCGKRCVNTSSDSGNCGSCGGACPVGQRCLNGRCFSEDTCPILQEACPNFRRCGVEDRDCFCGGTIEGHSVCFQDENFCESPRPCNATADCEPGRVCLDSSLCCAVRDMPEVPRTCVLPCASPSMAIAPAAKSAHKGRSGGAGPGLGN